MPTQAPLLLRPKQAWLQSRVGSLGQLPQSGLPRSRLPAKRVDMLQRALVRCYNSLTTTTHLLKAAFSLVISCKKNTKPKHRRLKHYTFPSPTTHNLPPPSTKPSIPLGYTSQLPIDRPRAPPPQTQPIPPPQCRASTFPTTTAMPRYTPGASRCPRPPAQEPPLSGAYSTAVWWLVLLRPRPSLPQNKH